MSKGTNYNQRDQNKTLCVLVRVSMSYTDPVDLLMQWKMERITETGNYGVLCWSRWFSNALANGADHRHKFSLVPIPIVSHCCIGKWFGSERQEHTGSYTDSLDLPMQWKIWFTLCEKLLVDIHFDHQIKVLHQNDESLAFISLIFRHEFTIISRAKNCDNHIKIPDQWKL